MRRSCAPCFLTDGLDLSRSHGSRRRSCGVRPPTVCAHPGPVNRFPFRHGGGQMRIGFDVRDVTLDYFPGFTPLGNAAGRVLIENGGLRGELTSGRSAGSRCAAPRVAIADLKAPVIDIDAAGNGDVGEALAMLRSPARPYLRPPVYAADRSGDTAVDLNCTSRRVIRTAAIRGAGPPQRRQRLSAAAARSGAARDRRARGRPARHTIDRPARQLSRWSVLGHGGIRRLIGTAARLRRRRGQRSRRGAELPAFHRTARRNPDVGERDWTLALGAQRQQQGDPWPTQLEVSSDLRGLAIDAPPPFAKTASDPRRTGLTLDYSPGGATEVDIRSGAAHARLAFRDRDGKSEFDRGALRFDDRALSLPATRGRQIDGDWPDFDLGRWLALGGDAPARRRSRTGWVRSTSAWRGRDSSATSCATSPRFSRRTTHWQVDLTGPQAAGRVTVPSISRAARRCARSAAAALESDAPRRDDDEAREPRRSAPQPALTVSADEFVWQGGGSARCARDRPRPAGAASA